MKLIHIVTVPFSLFFFNGQVDYMKKKGVDISIICSPGESLDDFGVKNSIVTYPILIERKIAPFRDLISIYEVWKCLIKEKPDIVHAHSPKGGLVGMISSFFANVPQRIYHIRGLPLMTANGYKYLLLWLSEKVSCLLADQVLCVSHSIREVAIQKNLCPPTKIKVLCGGSGNGVDAANKFNPTNQNTIIRKDLRKQYNIPPNALVLGFIGRIVRDKGIHELIEAWEILKKNFEELHLLIIGPFEPRDPIAVEVERILKSDTKIHLVGMNWDTPSFYSIMDVFTLPTYREGFPNVLLEASAMKLPIVATTVPGCTDAVIDNHTGMLVPAGNSIALADAINKYLIDSSLREIHGSQGREHVIEEFQQEDIWESIYQEYSLFQKIR